MGGEGATAAPPSYVPPSTTTQPVEPSGPSGPKGELPGKSMRADVLMREAKAQLNVGSQTVTITGELPADKKEKVDKTFFTVTGQMGEAGASVATIRTESGAKVEVEVTGAYWTYIKADKKFLDEREPLDSKLRKHADKWVQVETDSSPFKAFRPYDLARAYFLAKPMEPVDLKNSVVYTAEHDGERMYAVQIPRKSAGGQGNRLVWVTTEPGKHRIMEYTAGMYPSRTTLSFSGWGQDFTQPRAVRPGVPKLEN